MNMRMEIRRFDQKLHNWEHKAIFASEKLIHAEKFWVILAILLIMIGMIALAVFVRHGDGSMNRYMGPFGPFYPYGY